MYLTKQTKRPLKCFLLALPLLLSACGHHGGGGSHSGSGTNPTPTPTPIPTPASVTDAITIHVSSSNLHTETVTLTDSGTDSVSNIAAPEIGSQLSSSQGLVEDTANSTCTNMTFPMQPGGQCTYSFLADASTSVPGQTLSDEITIPVTFADSVTGNVKLSASITNYLYAANATGVYQWDGKTWSMSGTGPKNIAKLIADQSDSAIYAGVSMGVSGQGVYRWDGVNWTVVTGGAAPSSVNALAFTTLQDSVNHLFASTADSVSQYTNNAWASMGGGLTSIETLLESNPMNGTLYAGSATGVVGSDVNVYNGSTWTSVGSSGPSNVYALALNGTTNKLYAGSINNTASGSDVNVYDGGAWSELGTGAPVGVTALALDKSGNLFAVSRGNSEFSWTSQTGAGKGDWSAVASSADGKHLAVASFAQGEEISTSSDYGVTWTNHSATSGESWCNLASSSDGSHLTALSCTGGVIYTSSDYGNTWSQSSVSTLDWDGIELSSDGSRQVAVAVGSNIYASSDYGTTWTALKSSGSRWWKAIASSSDGKCLAAVVESVTNQPGYIYTSNDYGTTWTEHTSVGSKPWSSISSSADGKYLVAGTAAGNGANGGDIYTSNNYGATWTQETGTGSHSWQAIASSSDGSHVVAAALYDGVFASTDFGATWTLEKLPALPPLPAPQHYTWSAVASSSDGSRVITANTSGDIYTSSPASSSTSPNLSEFSNSTETWSSISGSGSEPDNIKALVLDNNSTLYTGSQHSDSGNDVNQYANGNWTALTDTGAPTNVTALTFGTQLSIKGDQQ